MNYIQIFLEFLQMCEIHFLPQYGYEMNVVINQYWMLCVCGGGVLWLIFFGNIVKPY